jgi:hypothetical protein
MTILLTVAGMIVPQAMFRHPGAALVLGFAIDEVLNHCRVH